MVVATLLMRKVNNCEELKNHFYLITFIAWREQDAQRECASSQKKIAVVDFVWMNRNASLLAHTESVERK